MTAPRGLGDPVYVAIREDEAGPWLDLGSASFTKDGAETNVAAKNSHAGAWASRNRVDRIIRCRIVPE